MDRKSAAHIITINIVLMAVLVVIIDILTYWIYPLGLAGHFQEYHLNPWPNIPGGGHYMHDYWIPHETRGFDIDTNKRALHWIDGETWEVWSNSMGCFDTEHESYDDYVYFAGDSFTWGFAPFEHKFGTLIERRTGTQILKCGIVHSGQQHQFDKFADAFRYTGKSPSAVFVFYYANDIANDYAYPHASVMDGWMVDNVQLNDENELVSVSVDTLQEKLHKRNAQTSLDIEARKRALSRVKGFLKQYSISVNVLHAGVSGLFESADDGDSTSEGSEAESGIATKSIYSLPDESDGRLWYTDNPFAEKNKRALLSFKSASLENGFRLVVVLLPPKAESFDDGWYAEVTAFLESENIENIDLTPHFILADKSPSTFYWRNDSHLNKQGNALVADILIQEFPAIFSKAND